MLISVICTINETQAIAEATAEVERANEDVHIRKLKAEAEQSRKRSIAAINAIAIHAASSLVAASKNPGQVLLCIWYIALLATGIYTAREVAKLCRVVLEQALGKPKLIRETTRKSVLYQGFESLLVILMELLNVAIQIDQEDAFHDVVLENDLKQRILSIATATEKVRKNGAPHRHVLFFGPPGTGKIISSIVLSHVIISIASHLILVHLTVYRKDYGCKENGQEHWNGLCPHEWRRCRTTWQRCSYSNP